MNDDWMCLIYVDWIVFWCISQLLFYTSSYSELWYEFRKRSFNVTFNYFSTKFVRSVDGLMFNKCISSPK